MTPEIQTALAVAIERVKRGDVEKVAETIWPAAIREAARLVEQERMSQASAARQVREVVFDSRIFGPCDGRDLVAVASYKDLLARQFNYWKRKPEKVDRRTENGGEACDLTKQIEALKWFVPAARFFYAKTNLADGRGSVPEAIRRTVSLPVLPTGWNDALRYQLLRALKRSAPPVCPPELRETILARDKEGKPLVPGHIAKQVLVNKSLIKKQRGPRNWSLENLSAPGSQRRHTNEGGKRVIMEPGDWFGGDDATPGIAVCVPCNEVVTPCSQKFGVLIGRFQWLAYHDGRTDKLLAHDYVVRPRGSYRAEDIINGMGAVTRTHGIPRKGWQFEGGIFNAKIVRQAIALMGCQHWKTYSPHQKAIELIFNRVWTRLAVQFPHADMGRYRDENESNCKLYEACKNGSKDPRRFFPSLETVLKVFGEEVATHNTRRIRSAQYGRWVPDELFQESVTNNPLRPLSDNLDWIFSPFSVERKVKGMIAKCSVPMFEGFSVPFEFSAEWMPLHNGRQVRLHFNPRDPKCIAKVVLLEAHGAYQAGCELGDAFQIGETAAHIRQVMAWAHDDQRIGYITRQRVNQFMHRETRGVGAGGKVEYSRSERRDGIGQVKAVEREATPRPSANVNPSLARLKSNLAETETLETLEIKRRDMLEFEQANQHLFT